MPLGEYRWPFTAALIADAPDSPGVFALWKDDELIYIGRAAGGGGLQKALAAHFSGTNDCTRSATHYSWEMTLQPEQRERQVLAEHYRKRKSIPRCNREEA